MTSLCFIFVCGWVKWPKCFSPKRVARGPGEQLSPQTCDWDSRCFPVMGSQHALSSPSSSQPEGESEAPSAVLAYIQQITKGWKKLQTCSLAGRKTLTGKQFVLQRQAVVVADRVVSPFHFLHHIRHEDLIKAHCRADPWRCHRPTLSSGLFSISWYAKTRRRTWLESMMGSGPD